MSYFKVTDRPVSVKKKKRKRSKRQMMWDDMTPLEKDRIRKGAAKGLAEVERRESEKRPYKLKPTPPELKKGKDWKEVGAAAEKKQQ